VTYALVQKKATAKYLAIDHGQRTGKMSALRTNFTLVLVHKSLDELSGREVIRGAIGQRIFIGRE
jgi:hypothetical protein